MTDAIRFETRCLHSLAKVFADEAPSPMYRLRQASALLNETFSFQVAYYADRLLKDLNVRVESETGDRITVRHVGLAPSEFTVQHDHDDNVLRTAPGLYPDPLLPLDEYPVAALPEAWKAVWLTLEPQRETIPGRTAVTVIFETSDGTVLGQERIELERIAARLPEQTLIHTEWFHADCLATHYGVDAFSERHWDLIKSYVKTAAAHGMNMLLTPLFTPPLDTAVGGERPTVQLVDVFKEGESYTFGFDRLKRWVEMCDELGIRYLEFSHLFTQWGAKHAPKIMAVEDGEAKRIFGWETDAAGEEYGRFLNQFLPELIAFIERNGLKERCYFHISDEPSLVHLDSYLKASRQVTEHLADFPIIDALSNYDFYERGLVKNPIPANNHIEPFLENQVPNLWTYYCVSQYKNVSNRFFAYPSARNRIIGMQLYKFQIAGFLHWGYNFWYTQYSRRTVDPFRQTDAGNAFPSGDPFLVYPGQDGPIESIRMEVFYEALQDLRALRLLESLIGRESTLALLEEDLETPLTFDSYPADPNWLRRKRETVNRKIKEAANG